MSNLVYCKTCGGVGEPKPDSGPTIGVCRFCTSPNIAPLFPKESRPDHIPSEEFCQTTAQATEVDFCTLLRACGDAVVETPDAAARAARDKLYWAAARIERDEAKLKEMARQIKEHEQAVQTLTESNNLRGAALEQIAVVFGKDNPLTAPGDLVRLVRRLQESNQRLFQERADLRKENEELRQRDRQRAAQEGEISDHLRTFSEKLRAACPNATDGELLRWFRRCVLKTTARQFADWLGHPKLSAILNVEQGRRHDQSVTAEELKEKILKGEIIPPPTAEGAKIAAVLLKEVGGEGTCLNPPTTTHPGGYIGNPNAVPTCVQGPEVIPAHTADCTRLATPQDRVASTGVSCQQAQRAVQQRATAGHRVSDIIGGKCALMCHSPYCGAPGTEPCDHTKESCARLGGAWPAQPRITSAPSEDEAVNVIQDKVTYTDNAAVACDHCRVPLKPDEPIIELPNGCFLHASCYYEKLAAVGKAVEDHREIHRITDPLT